jgi:hypothetical protein
MGWTAAWYLDGTEKWLHLGLGYGVVFDLYPPMID